MPASPAKAPLKSKAINHKPLWIDPGKFGRLGAFTGQADVKAHLMPRQQDIGENHGNEGEHNAHVNAGAGPKLPIMGAGVLLQVARSGKAKAFRDFSTVPAT